MNKTILINARHPEEKRVAIVDGQKLTDFYIEVSTAEHLRGNIYKGVVTSLEQGLQAAFVDFGQKRHGFLSLRDVMPELYLTKPAGKSPRIKEVLAKGQELVVQVDRDQRGTKGASLTTYISIPGRYIVMMPGSERVGISRKIEDQKARDRLKEAFKSLKVPKKMGFILRTAGVGHTAEELANDLKYLIRLWNKIKREAKQSPATCLIYKEEDIAVRTVRDYLTPDISEVLVDDLGASRNIRAFLKRTMPWRSINVTYYKQKKPLFDRHNLEDQIARLGDRQVVLPSGGHFVIDKTEALTAIDVNSGRSKKSKGIEALALRTNIEAADEVARQLRLRDIGGLIVIDFIDMESGKNRIKVEERLRKALDPDKAHFDISRISKFGMLEMSRERMRTAYFESTNRTCPTCGGGGVLKSPDIVAMSALRDIHSQLSRGGLKSIVCRLPVESANYLMNTLRDSLSAVEKEFSAHITVLADHLLTPGKFSIETEKVQQEENKETETRESAEPTGEAGTIKQSTSSKKIRRKRRPARKKEAPTTNEGPAPEQKETGPAPDALKPEPESERSEQVMEAPAESEEKKKRPSRRTRNRRIRSKKAPATKETEVQTDNSS
jgi:ribonuclease E